MGIRSAMAVVVVGLGLAGIVLLDAHRALVDTRTELRLAMATERLGAGGAAWPWLFPWFAVANPWIEERFWRGAVLPALGGRGCAGSGSAVVSGIAFGIWHFLPCCLLFPPSLAVLGTCAIMFAGVGIGYWITRGGDWRDAAWVHAWVADVPLLVVLWSARGGSLDGLPVGR